MKITETAARQSLRKLLEAHSGPDSDMAANSIAQINFAVQHASDAAVEDYMKWYEAEPTNALETLMQGRYNYLENFGAVPASQWLQITVEIDSEPGKLSAKEVVSRIFDKLEEIEPFSLGIHMLTVCDHQSTGSYYLLADFQEDGDCNTNPVLGQITVTYTGGVK